VWYSERQVRRSESSSSTVLRSSVIIVITSIGRSSRLALFFELCGVASLFMATGGVGRDPGALMEDRSEGLEDGSRSWLSEGFIYWCLWLLKSSIFQ